MSSLPAYQESPLSDIDEVSQSIFWPMDPCTDLVQTYDRLQARFATHVTRSVHYRTYNLKQLAYMIKDNTGLIEQALKADLGKGTFDASLSDVSPSVIPSNVRFLRDRSVVDASRFG